MLNIRHTVLHTILDLRSDGAKRQGAEIVKNSCKLVRNTWVPIEK